MKTLPLLERFERHYIACPMSGCWLWTGCIQKDINGKETYGRLRSDIEFMAHRISYVLFIGPIPKRMQVCHMCDLMCCVNPAHLFLGTQLDNVRDMIAKGRVNAPKGERHRSAKLTEADVCRIRTMYDAGGVSQKELGRQFGVFDTNISAIVRGETWAHLSPLSRCAGCDRRVIESDLSPSGHCPVCQARGRDDERELRAEAMRRP